MIPKIALLIDAENISYKDLPRILEEVRGQGQIVLRAAYGDWQNSHLQKWQEVAEANDFKIRRQTSSLKKNSSDLKLIMDAMEVLYTTSINVFCLVSNDADYVPLCDKIHESKKRVIGVGYQHAADTFIRSCDRFIFIGRGEVPVQPLIPSVSEVPEAPPKPVAAPPPPITKPTPLPDIRKLLSQAFTRAPQDANQWVTLTALGQALSQIQVGFQTNTYGHTTLTKLLQSLPDFVELKINGTDTTTRLKNKVDSKPSTPSTTPIQNLLQEAFAQTPCVDKQWVLVSALGDTLHRIKADFKSNAYGHSTLSKLLQSMPDFLEVRGKGGTLAARLKK